MKRIIIIGATSGIGRSVSLKFVSAGWKVGIAARREEELKKLASEAPSQIFYEIIDVTSDNASESLSSLINKVGGMDIFFLSSGVGFQNPQLESEIEIKTIRTNVMGFTMMIDGAYKYFKEHGGNGQIAAISSIAGTKGLGVAASYSATKRYQNTYLDAIDQLAHLENLDLKVTDIRPGFVKTNLLNDGHSYPMLLDAEKVGGIIFKVLINRKRVKIIDWRYAILVFFWRLIPQCIWSRLKIKTSK